MTVKECYEKLNGNYSDVMERLESEKFVSKYLIRFIDLTDFDDMIKAINEKNWECGFRASHNLKGTCLNLSFTELAHSSSELCETMRHGAPEKDNSALVAKVTEDYKVVMDALKQYKSEL